MTTVTEGTDKVPDMADGLRDISGWLERVDPMSEREPFSEMTQRFLDYHAANPQVLVAFVDVIRETYIAGVRKLGMQCVVEVVRWRLTVSAAAQANREGQEIRGQEFGIPNDHAAYYARLIAARYPKHLGEFFRFRSCEADIRTDEWIAEATK